MVTFAFPAFKPFMVPFLVTVTIFLLLVVQLLMESPFARPVTFTFVVDCFTFSLMLEAVTLMVGVSLLPLYGFPFFPCCWCASGFPGQIRLPPIRLSRGQIPPGLPLVSESAERVSGSWNRSYSWCRGWSIGTLYHNRIIRCLSRLCGYGTFTLLPHLDWSYQNHGNSVCCVHFQLLFQVR